MAAPGDPVPFCGARRVPPGAGSVRLDAAPACSAGCGASYPERGGRCRTVVALRATDPRSTTRPRVALCSRRPGRGWQCSAGPKASSDARGGPAGPRPHPAGPRATACPACQSCGASIVYPSCHVSSCLHPRITSMDAADSSGRGFFCYPDEYTSSSGRDTGKRLCAAPQGASHSPVLSRASASTTWR